MSTTRGNRNTFTWEFMFCVLCLQLLSYLLINQVNLYPHFNSMSFNTKGNTHVRKDAYFPKLLLCAYGSQEQNLPQGHRDIHSGIAIVAVAHHLGLPTCTNFQCLYSVFGIWVWSIHDHSMKVALYFKLIKYLQLSIHRKGVNQNDI